MVFIIGVSGKLGTGKNYITTNVILPVLEKLQKKYLEIAFADQIKVNVMTKNGINYSDVYENKTHESRQLLQKEGTEVGRESNPNIWIDYLDNWIKVYCNRGINTFITSDVRFLNEFEYIKNQCNGIMIKIIAPKRNEKRLLQESDGSTIIYEKISTHRSECDLDNLTDDTYDLVINNDNSICIIKLMEKFENILLKKKVKDLFF